MADQWEGVVGERWEQRGDGGTSGSAMGSEPLRVLIVGDSGDQARVMAEALREGFGAVVSSCGSAGDAVRRIRRERVDAIVLEYRLLEAEGWETLKTIGNGPRAPIAVVTGEGSDSAAAARRAVEGHRRRREEISGLNKASRAVAASLELEEVVEAALEGVMALLRPDGAWLLLPDEEGVLALVGSRGVTPGRTADPGARFESCVRAPVAAKQGQAPGFLCAGADSPEAFDAHDGELLNTIAGHTASAVANAQLFGMLVRAKRQWERTFDSISDPILISDDRFRVMRLNRAAAHCLKLRVQEGPGRVCHELLLGSQEPCPWHDAVLRGVPVSSDRYLPHVGRWFGFSAFPFAEADGRAVGVVHVLRDITEERRGAVNDRLATRAGADE